METLMVGQSIDVNIHSTLALLRVTLSCLELRGVKWLVTDATMTLVLSYLTGSG